MAPRFLAWPSAIRAGVLAMAMLLPAAVEAQEAPTDGRNKPVAASRLESAKPDQSKQAGSQKTPQKDSAPEADAPSGPVSATGADALRSSDSVDRGGIAGGSQQYGGFGDMIFIVIGVLLALIAAVLIGLLIKRRREPKASQDSEEPGMGYNNLTSSRRGLVSDDHKDTVISDLLRRVLVMEQRITALENGGASRAFRAAVPEQQPQPQTRSGYASDNPDNYYDRRSQPQDLPEDNWPVAHRAPLQASHTEPPPAAQPSSGSMQQFAADLAELFNRASKPDFDALASQYGAESYTNDRRGELAQLIKGDLDRFWVVPVPGRPELALMIPGFTVKKSWAKLRQPETDHPLAYHFDLRRGDRLQVIRPALLRRNSNNFWELQQKGEVVGIS